MDAHANAAAAAFEARHGFHPLARPPGGRPPAMDYAAFCAMRDRLNAALAASVADLKALGANSGPLGLTPDAIKASPAFREARNANASAFNALRHLNQMHGKRFAADDRAARDFRRVIRLAVLMYQASTI